MSDHEEIAEKAKTEGAAPVGPLQVPAEEWARALAESRERAAREDDLDRLIFEARNARMTHCEISRLLGISPATVGRRLQRIGKETGRSVS